MLIFSFQNFFISILLEKIENFKTYLTTIFENSILSYIKKENIFGKIVFYFLK